MLDELPHLLVPVDFRPASRAAVRVALEMASGASARVTLLHVVPEEPLSDLDAIGYLHRASMWLRVPGPGSAFPGDAEARSADALRRLEGELHPDWRGSVPIRLAVRRGDVAAEVARYAAEEGADRVVVGVNRPGWRLSLRPRLSGRIARQAARPVVIVHPVPPGERTLHC
jgi:nucleotide-binding universal stress UspA family protein